MRKILLVLFTTTIALTTNAQEMIAAVSNPSYEIKISDKMMQDAIEKATYEIKTNSSNVETKRISKFEREIQNKNTPSYTKYFENLASKMGERTIAKKGIPDEPFHLKLKSDKGHMKITYDTDGALIHAKERFSNIALPKDVRKFIYQKYKGWLITSTLYEVEYNQGESPILEYAILLQKDNQMKNIRIDANAIK
ncbi:hypothetical protein [Aquimarina pacifica]|uniref:hypothetical protein n=1 Tax=Aquimarina pacifica TaxID=1296415 RepID=UPI000470E376|nr:hypothetical protein [Aquimarina pacifica]